jgi:hypothetical protein
MQKPVAQRLIDVRSGPRYDRDLELLTKQHPSVSSDVEKVLNNIIKPAILANPKAPHEHGAGTPIHAGTLNIRVPNSAGASGSSGGFRFLYHWDHRTKTIIKLSITLRRDAVSFPARAVKKLLKDAGK